MIPERLTYAAVGAEIRVERKCWEEQFVGQDENCHFCRVMFEV